MDTRELDDAMLERIKYREQLLSVIDDLLVEELEDEVFHALVLAEGAVRDGGLVPKNEMYREVERRLAEVSEEADRTAKQARATLLALARSIAPSGGFHS